MNLPNDANPKINAFLRTLQEEPEHHAVPATIRPLTESSKESGRRLNGQISIEKEQGELPSMFTIYPSGDFWCWWCECGYFIIVALVDEKCKCLGVISVLELGKFKAAINNIANQLNLKNNYPVQNPDDFKPVEKEEVNE